MIKWLTKLLFRYLSPSFSLFFYFSHSHTHTAPWMGRWLQGISHTHTFTLSFLPGAIVVNPTTSMFLEGGCNAKNITSQAEGGHAKCYTDSNRDQDQHQEPVPSTSARITLLYLAQRLSQTFLNAT